MISPSKHSKLSLTRFNGTKSCKKRPTQRGEEGCSRVALRKIKQITISGLIRVQM
jgi:hypothetical protein